MKKKKKKQTVYFYISRGLDLFRIRTIFVNGKRFFQHMNATPLNNLIFNY